MIKSLIPYLRLAVDMVISYFIVYWLMFFSGLFYYLEPQKWAVDVIILSLVSGILVTFVTSLSLYLVNELMNNDPNNGGYLLFTIAVSVLTVSLSVVDISQKILHYHILMSPNLILVYIFIIYPALFLTFISRADKHM